MRLSPLSASIAWRYLRAPKSRSAVGAISLIAVVGVAVATAAIICVLSVFNGFRSILADRLDTLAPDVLVAPASGKTFADADSVAALVARVKGVGTVMPVVADNALAIFNSREMPVALKGVDPTLYPRVASLDSLLTSGNAPVAALSPEQAVVSIGVAAHLGIGDTDGRITIFAPRREGRVNLANPVASFITDSVAVAGIFQSLQSDYDEKTIICDISLARELFQYSSEASSLEVAVAPGADPQAVAAGIRSALGQGAVVKDRLEQQEMNFRMISIEKWVTFLLLIFILAIASFNIISTLCMVIIEKQQSMATLSALGMRASRIAAIFRWESFYVALAGGGAGVVLGLALCLLQERFGLIRLSADPSSLSVTAYPVVVVASDVALAMAPVLAVGLVTALVAGRFSRSRI